MTTPPVSPPPEPPPPSQNIGPFYRLVGVAGALASCGIIVLLILHGTDITVPVVGLAALPFVLSILLARPPLLDALVRRLMTKLPFTKYGDPDADR